jgi:hypothetical protein
MSMTSAWQEGPEYFPFEQHNGAATAHVGQQCRSFMFES